LSTDEPEFLRPFGIYTGAEGVSSAIRKIKIAAARAMVYMIRRHVNHGVTPVVFYLCGNGFGEMEKGMEI
jgi:hypothetical protein